MSGASPGCWALIPVKARGTGKTRLAGVLDADGRERLVSAMLDRVVRAASACPAIARVCVVGSAGRAANDGVTYVADQGGGLNPAIQAALAMLAGHGADRVIVLAGDLPLIDAADLALMADVSEAVIALAPDRHGTGTNAISLPCAALGAFQVQFGDASHAAHRTEAFRLGYTVETMLSDGLEKDIDAPADLADAQGCLQEAR